MSVEISPREALDRWFGFPDFREGQLEVTEQLLAGHSALAVFPTGSGKSLCYQLPACIFSELTLVVSPLIALMKDQIDFLHRRNIPAARLDSSLSLEEYRAVWDQIRSGSLKMLYVAPERLSNERFRSQLERVKIAMMVIDEAHCMSEWGHNFRPDYLKLARVAEQLAVPRVLALTATATPQVAADICALFSIRDEAYVNIGYYRPNLELRLTPTPLKKRGYALLARLQQRAAGATIVYVTLQKTAEQLADWLQQKGLPAAAYHAGLDAEVRSKIQDEFMAGAESIVVATIAFGMGIDKSNIRYVYHYNMPKSLENYAQEIGRAGRDGVPAICEALLHSQDRIVLENFTYGDTPEPSSVLGLVRELHGLGDSFDVSVYDLSTRYDIRPLVVNTLLCYLELGGVLAGTAPFYSVYKIAFLIPEGEAMGRFDAARQTFLRTMLGHGRSGRKWLSLDVTEAAQAMGEQRSRLLAAVNYMEEQGMIQTQVSGVRQGYRRTGAQFEPEAVASEIIARFKSSESRDIQRIGRLEEILLENGCVVRRLLGYFGEELGQDCGHCDWCKGERPEAGPSLERPDLTEPQTAVIRKLAQDAPAALQSPRQRAKFLCGIASPATSRSRPSLTRDPRFASLEDVPFAAVLAAAESCA